MGSQLDLVLFADERRQQIGESLLGGLRELGGGFLEVHDQRRQIAIGLAIKNTFCFCCQTEAAPGCLSVALSWLACGQRLGRMPVALSANGDVAA